MNMPNSKLIISKAFLRGGFFLLLLMGLVSCKEEPAQSTSPKSESEFYRAADLSAWPKISQANLDFYNSDSLSVDFLSILQNQGLNTVRLRIWHSPENNHHSLAQVDSFAQVLRSRGLKIWLCLHLSDTWADPGHQEIPQAWEALTYAELKDSLYAYVYKINQKIKPEILQIGNEVNPGFLLPFGDRYQAPSQFKSLLDTAILAARSAYADAEIMLHYAGIDAEAQAFFENLASTDFDIIGLSYYPIWHGKSLTALKNRFLALGLSNSQKLMVAETAYPFTLAWNDWTNNIVGSEDQLIPGYPASPEGQKRFFTEVRSIVSNVPNGIGFAYWGGELIAWKGPQANDASPFENQALFNFNNVALPVQEVFQP